MVHRFMKEEGLLIKRNPARGASRPHTGKIAVEQPNTRWASDITSIKCRNGQKLRFTYVLDCCDRSIIAWKAGTHMQASDMEFDATEPWSAVLGIHPLRKIRYSSCMTTALNILRGDSDNKLRLGR